MSGPGGETKGNKIGRLVAETLDLEKQLAQILIKLDDRRAEIQKYFDEQGIKNLEVTSKTDANLKIIAKKVERMSITYDAAKLKERLDPEIFLEVAKRTYTINDIEAMMKLVKENGISAKEFKSLIDIDVKINNEAMKRLYDANEISLKDLKGCYTAKISKTIKLEESQGDTN